MDIKTERENRNINRNGRAHEIRMNHYIIHPKHKTQNVDDSENNISEERETDYSEESSYLNDELEDFEKDQDNNNNNNYIQNNENSDSSNNNIDNENEDEEMENYNNNSLFQKNSSLYHKVSLYDNDEEFSDKDNLNDNEYMIYNRQNSLYQQSNDSTDSVIIIGDSSDNKVSEEELSDNSSNEENDYSEDITYNNINQQEMIPQPNQINNINDDNRKDNEDDYAVDSDSDNDSINEREIFQNSFHEDKDDDEILDMTVDTPMLLNVSSSFNNGDDSNDDNDGNDTILFSNSYMEEKEEESNFDSKDEVESKDDSFIDEDKTKNKISNEKYMDNNNNSNIDNNVSDNNESDINDSDATKHNDEEEIQEQIINDDTNNINILENQNTDSIILDLSSETENKSQHFVSLIDINPSLFEIKSPNTQNNNYHNNSDYDNNNGDNDNNNNENDNNDNIDNNDNNNNDDNDDNDDNDNNIIDDSNSDTFSENNINQKKTEQKEKTIEIKPLDATRLNEIVEDMEDDTHCLNIEKEHKSYCPWIYKRNEQGNQLPGWEITMNAIIAYLDPKPTIIFSENKKNFSIKDTHDLLNHIKSTLSLSSSVQNSLSNKRQKL